MGERYGEESRQQERHSGRRMMGREEKKINDGGRTGKGMEEKEEKRRAKER